MALRGVSLAVVGARHPNKRGDPSRLFEIRICKPGDPVRLVPEPKNEFDELAIQVVSERGVIMGYVTAERAPLVGGWLRSGRAVEAVFQRATQYGAVIGVAREGAAIVLPPPGPAVERGVVDADAEWWPDEVPPDC